jgi:putative ABC transport system permease protein
MRLTLAGLAVGIVCATAFNRFLTNLLYGVDTGDVSTYAAVAALLAVITLLAVYIPARRASKVDPMASLRYE